METPAGAMGFGGAIRYLRKLGMSNIEAYERKLSSVLMEEMTKIDGLEYIGPAENRAALLHLRDTIQTIYCGFIERSCFYI